MNDVTIYTTPTCGYCRAAKRLLKMKGIGYTEIDLAAHPERREEMIQRANGGKTVPQIFIGDRHIGGFDDMDDLERSGKLDTLLAA